MFGPSEPIVGDGKVMSATETGIAEDDAADVADVEMTEEVMGLRNWRQMSLNSPRRRFDPKGVGAKSEQQMPAALLQWRKPIQRPKQEWAENPASFWCCRVRALASRIWSSTCRQRARYCAYRTPAYSHGVQKELSQKKLSITKENHTLVVQRALERAW